MFSEAKDSDVRMRGILKVSFAPKRKNTAMEKKKPHAQPTMFGERVSFNEIVGVQLANQVVVIEI